MNPIFATAKPQERKFEIYALNPTTGNIFLNTNTFDDVERECSRIDCLFDFQEANKINIVISCTVREETLHSYAPPKVKELAEKQIFTIQMQLIGEERDVVLKVIGRH